MRRAVLRRLRHGSLLLFAACGGATLDERVDALQAAYDAGDHSRVLEAAPALVEACRAEQAGLRLAQIPYLDKR